MAETWTDSEIVRQCRTGDGAAWRELVKRFTPLVYRLALRILGNPVDAADVSQEVFLRIHRSLDSFDPTRPLTPWVSRIAYNACLKRIGKEKRSVLPPEYQDDRDALRILEPPNPESEVLRREAQDYLLEALTQLSAQDRGLLVLRYREGLSDAEVSEATGMPVNTVKTRIFRSRKRLRQILAPVLRETS